MHGTWRTWLLLVPSSLTHSCLATHGSSLHTLHTWSAAWSPPTHPLARSPPRSLTPSLARSCSLPEACLTNFNYYLDTQRLRIAASNMRNQNTRKGV